jgi:uncharacterized protein (TIGR03437 family)
MMLSILRWGLTGIALTGAMCLAQTTAVVPTGGDSGTDPRPFVIGYEFSVSSSTAITALGYLDANSAGLNESHQVGIFRTSDGTLLTSATIPAGTGAKYVNGIRTVPVSFTLAPGDYVIAGQKTGNADFAIVRATGASSIPGVKYIQEREAQTSTFSMPPSNFAANEVGSFGPDFTVAAASGAPVISGFGNAASFLPVFAPNLYVSIFGSNLSTTTRTWTATDFKNGTQMPTSLDGVSVTVNGTPAYVEYVSPSQLNIITPDIPPSPSGMAVVVNVPNQQPVTAWIGMSSLAPALFTWQTGTPDTGKYVVAQHSDYSNVGKAGLFPNQSGSFTTPAKPGETIILYGTGFGPTNPAITPGIMTDKTYPISPLPTATIGGQPAQVQFAGLIATLSQIYQVNVTIPTNVGIGDQPLILNVNGTPSATGTITVSH